MTETELSPAVEGNKVFLTYGEEKGVLTFASPEDAATWADWWNECAKSEPNRDHRKLASMVVPFPTGKTA